MLINDNNEDKIVLLVIYPNTVIENYYLNLNDKILLFTQMKYNAMVEKAAAFESKEPLNKSQNSLSRHSGVGQNPVKTIIYWMLVFTGMTGRDLIRASLNVSKPFRVFYLSY